MKRIIYLILCMSIMIMPGCSFENDSILLICFKSGKSLNFGYSAAIYDNRIYYVSNEFKDSGIYSMNLDGSDLKLELENPSITSIEIYNGSIYFNGLKGIAEKVTDPGAQAKNCHAIFSYSLRNNQFDFLGYGNIMDFYISKDGIKLICKGSLVEYLSMYDINNSLIDREKQNRTTISFDYHEDTVKNDFYRIGDLIIAAQWLPSNISDQNFLATSHPYVLDTNSGELVLKYTSDLIQKDRMKAFFIDDKYIYCSYNEMIVILDKTSFDVKNKIIPNNLTSDYNIEYITKYGDNIYVIANRWQDARYSIPPLLDEKLYIMNSGNFECNELSDFGSRQRIIGLDENCIILLENGEIFKEDLNNGAIGEKKKLIDAPSDIYSKNYTIDYAGNWMFIYKTYPENGSVYNTGLPGQQLLYKINLQTGEIIKNDNKLDFSALDSYKEK